MKWNLNNILCYINIKKKCYYNTKLKQGTFRSLFNELNEKQLIRGIDVYRQELHKIKVSMKSGCGTTRKLFGSGCG